MIDELEKEFRSIGIEIKSHGYYKTIGEIFEELKNKWNFIPLMIGMILYLQFL